MRTWLLTHRLLLVVYAGLLLLAALELTDPTITVDQPDTPDVYLEPERNIADVSAALYPDRALSLYYRAYQATLCAGTDPRAPTSCRERGPVAPGEIRELLERSLATGNRSVELAMYNYALVLIQEGAPEAEVEAAIRNWRVSHPESARPDPRALAAELRRRRNARAR